MSLVKEEVRAKLLQEHLISHVTSEYGAKIKFPEPGDGWFLNIEAGPFSTPGAANAFIELFTSDEYYAPEADLSVKMRLYEGDVSNAIEKFVKPKKSE